MKNGTRIFLIVIIILLMLAIAGSYAYCMVQKYADAEYADIVGTSDIVNFNQLLQVPTFEATTTGAVTQIVGNSVQLIVNHTYYFKTNAQYRQFSNNIDFAFSPVGVFTYTNTTTNNTYLLYATTISGQKYTFMLIDLTQMFGSGNEPNLNEAAQYFTADYYKYNSGTPMAYNGVDNYYQAINDVFANYTYQIDRSALNTSTYPYNILSEDSEFYYNNVNWILFGAAAMPLFTTLSSGTNMTIDFYFYTPNASAIDVCVASLNSDNTLTELSTVRYSFGNDGTLNFVLPFDVSTIVIYARDISTHQYYDLNTLVQKLNIKASQLDVAGMILSAYDSGYQYVMRLYEVGGPSWHSIYDAGYFKGQEDGSAVLTAMDYVKAAFVKLGEILMIEVFPNITLGAFFLFPIITSLIFFVFKLVKGGGD